MNIVQRLASVFAQRPNDLAFVWRGSEWTYSKLQDSVESAARALAEAGVRRGDRVTISMPNCPNLAISLLACLQRGFVAVPLNTRFKGREAQSAIELIDPALHLATTSGAADISDLKVGTLPFHARVTLDEENEWEAPVAAARANVLSQFKESGIDGPALLLPTSGTTAHPKIVVHTRATLGAIASRYDALGLRDDDVMLNASPIVHAGGLFNLLASLVRSGPMVMLDTCGADAVLDAIQENGCTWMKALPFVFGDMANAQSQRSRNVDSLRFCVASGDAVPRHMVRDFESAFGLPLASAWASTEGATTLSYSDRPQRGYCVCDGGEARLAELGTDKSGPGATGELLVRGPHVSPGYWLDVQEFARHPDGWFRTGDVFRLAADGGLAFVSRLKTLIIRGGSNISPHEVEEVLRDDPVVLDAVVFGIPDARLGERVAALIEVEPAIRVSTDAILKRVRVRLSDYKVPEIARIVPRIPRSANGKIDRTLLPALLAANPAIV